MGSSCAYGVVTQQLPLGVVDAPPDPSVKDAKTPLTKGKIHKDLPNDNNCQGQQRALHNRQEMRKRSRQGKLYLAQVGFASEVIDEGFGCQAFIVGRVAGVHLDARVYNGHPVLLAAVQLLYKGLRATFLGVAAAATSSHQDYYDYGGYNDCALQQHSLALMEAQAPQGGQGGAANDGSQLLQHLGRGGAHQHIHINYAS
ncbi:MAG: hypothetical protein FRX49_13190, partial [Trebouxia sp. A1-2]